MNKRSLLVNAVLVTLFVCLFFACEKENTPEKLEVSFGKINGFVIDELGTKILASDNGLISLNEKNGTYERLNKEAEVFPVNDLLLVKTNPENELWLATNNGAFNFTAQKRLNTTNSGLHSNIVKHLNFDINRTAFFATNDGISILQNNKWTKSLGLNDVYLNFEISDIASASNGYTYVTTKGGGIERFELEVDGISSATIFDSDWTKLESNHVNTLFIDSITQVYGTDYGVAFHFSEYTKWDWEIYTSKDGLINDTVLAIVQDNSKNWWFGTSQGISMFDNKSWTNFSKKSHFILSNRIQFLAKDIDGSIWFASDEGLAHFINNEWLNYPKKAL